MSRLSAWLNFFLFAQLDFVAVSRDRPRRGARDKAARRPTWPRSGPLDWRRPRDMLEWADEPRVWRNCSRGRPVGSEKGKPAACARGRRRVGKHRPALIVLFVGEFRSINWLVVIRPGRAPPLSKLFAFWAKANYGKGEKRSRSLNLVGGPERRSCTHLVRLKTAQRQAAASGRRPLPAPGGGSRGPS